MKTVTILRFFTFLGSGLSALAAIDLSGVATLLEPGVAKYLLAAGPAALAVKELVVVLGDLFDDGKPNKSFKIGLLCFAMAAITLPFLTACTTQPPVTGEFATKAGQIKVYPNGRFEIVVEPRTAK